MARRPRFPFASPRGQRGSILAPAAFAVLVGVMLLGAAQLGYVFYVKRDAQKAADLAALTGAQVLDRDEPDSCTAAIAAARQAAQANADGEFVRLEAGCVHWQVVQGDPPAGQWADVDPASPTAAQDANAVRVDLALRAPVLFAWPGQGGPGERSVDAQAVARGGGQPQASFRVGTRLAAVTPPALLTDLLKGVGVDLDGTALLGYDAGLANVQITPAGLLHELGVDIPVGISAGELNELLATKTFPLGDVLDAVVNVAGRDSLLDANVGLVQALETKLGVNDLNVRLGSETEAAAGGLFAFINTDDPTAALDTRVDALGLISTAAGVATGGHALAAGQAINLPLPGGGISIQPRIAVVEPPSVAIGGEGARAYSAQLRAYAPVSFSTSLAGLATLSADLPITVDLAGAQATLERLCRDRDAQGRDLAHIAVDSSLLKVCIGNPPAGASAGWPFSTKDSCDQGLTDAPLLSLKTGPLLGSINLASLNAKVVAPVLSAPGEADFYEGQTLQVPGSANPLLLGQTVQDVTDGLLAALLGSSLRGSGPAPQDMAQKLWDDTASICTASTSSCRQQRMNQAAAAIDDAASGLGGFLGGLSSGVLGLTDSLLTLNLPGLLGSVGNLTGSLGGLVGNLLAGCTSGILGVGPESTCVSQLQNVLAQQQSGQPSGATITLTGMLLSTLRPVLDAVGSQVLKPMLENVVGVQLGQTDVNLMSLDCAGRGVQLVY